jgi:hypothetical protein
LICHQEDYIVRAYAGLVREVKRDSKFARRVEESSRRVLAFKKRWKLRRVLLPTAATEVLSRQIWEFNEEIRLATLGLSNVRQPERS